MAKILIVDDEPSIRELYKYVFEEAGYQVDLAGNGLQALEALGRSLPDFMVLDVSMPEMSGKEFVVELGRRGVTDGRLNAMPFVVMTGENFMEAELDKVFAKARGFVCYYPKMTPPETVLARVVEILGGRN